MKFGRHWAFGSKAFQLWGAVKESICCNFSVALNKKYREYKTEKNIWGFCQTHTTAKRSPSLPISLSPSRIRALRASKGRNIKTLLNAQCIHPNYIFSVIFTFCWWAVSVRAALWERLQEGACVCGCSEQLCREKSLMVWQWFGAWGGRASPQNAAPGPPGSLCSPFFITQQCERSKCKPCPTGCCRMGAEASDLHNEGDGQQFCLWHFVGII